MSTLPLLRWKYANALHASGYLFEIELLLWQLASDILARLAVPGIIHNSFMEEIWPTLSAM